VRAAAAHLGIGLGELVLADSRGRELGTSAAVARTPHSHSHAPLHVSFVIRHPEPTGGVARAAHRTSHTTWVGPIFGDHLKAWALPGRLTGRLTAVKRP
jgi:hypothetical protein